MADVEESCDLKCLYAINLNVNITCIFNEDCENFQCRSKRVAELSVEAFLQILIKQNTLNDGGGGEDWTSFTICVIIAVKWC